MKIKTIKKINKLIQTHNLSMDIFQDSRTSIFNSGYSVADFKLTLNIRSVLFSFVYIYKTTSNALKWLKK